MSPAEGHRYGNRCPILRIHLTTFEFSSCPVRWIVTAALRDSTQGSRDVCRELFQKVFQSCCCFSTTGTQTFEHRLMEASRHFLSRSQPTTSKPQKSPRNARCGVSTHGFVASCPPNKHNYSKDGPVRNARPYDLVCDLLEQLSGHSTETSSRTLHAPVKKLPLLATIFDPDESSSSKSYTRHS